MQKQEGNCADDASEDSENSWPPKKEARVEAQLEPQSKRKKTKTESAELARRSDTQLLACTCVLLAFL